MSQIPRVTAFAGALNAALGVVLITAALLKAFAAWKLPSSTTELWPDGLMTVAVIEAELACGALALSGAFRRAVRTLLTVVFSVFAAVAFARMIDGSESCGCFGVLEVPPAAAFTIDVMAVVALICASAKDRLMARGPSHVSIRRQKIAAVAAGVLAIGAAVVLLSRSRLEPIGPGLWLMRDRTALCEPDAWVGQELPILPFVDSANRLRSGRWNVLFYHPKCNACQARLKAHLSGQETEKVDQWNHAVVSTASLSEGAEPAVDRKVPRVLSGSLNQELRWLLRTPLNVWLADGVVVGIRTADGQTLGDTD